MAKAFAMARGIPLVGVNTLDAEAQPFLGMGLPVCAIVGAGKVRVYSALYCDGATSGYRVQSHEELAAGITEKTLLCGEGLPEVEELVRGAGGRPGHTGRNAPSHQEAGGAGPAWVRTASERRRQSPESLEPIYMRAAQIAAAQRNRKE